jgi:hypothetical protein
MCKDNTTTTTTNSTNKQHSTSGPDEWVRNEGHQLYDQIKNSVNESINMGPYEGQRLANYGPEWGQTKDLIQGLTTPTGDFDKARGALDGVLANSQPKTVEELMNPYIGTVLDANLRRMAEAHLQNQNGLAAQATGSGAFGDARHGVEEGVMNGQYVRDTGDMTNKVYSDAWGTAQNQQNVMMERLKSLAPMYQGVDAAEFNRTTSLGRYLTDIAERDKAHSQAGLNIEYGDWLEQRDRPLMLQNTLMDILNKTPNLKVSDMEGSSNSVSEATTPSAGPWGMIGQVAGSVLGGPLGGAIGGSLGGAIGGGGGAAPAYSPMQHPMAAAGPIYAQPAGPVWGGYN